MALPVYRNVGQARGDHQVRADPRKLPPLDLHGSAVARGSPEYGGQQRFSAGSGDTRYADDLPGPNTQVDRREGSRRQPGDLEHRRAVPAVGNLGRQVSGGGPDVR